MSFGMGYIVDIYTDFQDDCGNTWSWRTTYSKINGPVEWEIHLGPTGDMPDNTPEPGTAPYTPEFKPSDKGVPPLTGGELLCVTHVTCEDWLDDAHVLSYPEYEWLYDCPENNDNSQFVLDWPTEQVVLDSIPNWRESKCERYEMKSHQITVGYITVWRNSVIQQLKVWYRCNL